MVVMKTEMYYYPRYKKMSYMKALLEHFRFTPAVHGMGYEIQITRNRHYRKNPTDTHRGARLHAVFSDGCFNLHEDNRSHKVVKKSQRVANFIKRMKAVEAILP